MILRWNHLFGQNFFVNTSIIYNTYLLDLSTLQGKYYAQVYSGINDKNAKTEFQYFPNNKHIFRFGVNYTHHTFISSGKPDRVPSDIVSLPKSENYSKYIRQYSMSPQKRQKIVLPKQS